MNRRLTYLLFLLLSVFSFCSSCEMFENKKHYKTYIIKEGTQHSHSTLEWVHRKELRFLAKFDYTAMYSSIDPINQYDINKLYGFSDCGDSHHANSARFGWRWFDNQIEIFAYCYKDSERLSEYIASVQPDEENEYKISFDDDRYIFSLKGNTIVMPRGCSRGGARYYLFPFFGGDEKAPHDITIRIKELD